ncbi:MAG TPA: polymer-forming cytoskeletal protein [Nannocystaceae bacterium]|nr:polymer-forming cytoskeletal protein [Nannocystaceae bacterium]
MEARSSPAAQELREATPLPRQARSSLDRTDVALLACAGLAAPAPRSTTCVLGPQITVRGSLSGEEDLVVEGRLEGSVALAGHLVVAQGGVVEADLDVASVEVHGEVRGDIVASRSITIERGAQVAGNVRAPRVIIHDGARFDGAVEMDVQLPDGLGRGR